MAKGYPINRGDRVRVIETGEILFVTFSRLGMKAPVFCHEKEPNKTTAYERQHEVKGPFSYGELELIS